MTHTAEQERVDTTVFKRLLNDYADCLRNGDFRCAGAAFLAVVAEYQQAARRAPATPQNAPISDALPQGFISDVLTAAGLVRHGKQCKALADRLGDAIEKIWTTSIDQRKAIAAAPQPPEVEENPLQEQLDEALQSLEFYKRRCDLLQSIQPRMRDPERAMVCDVLANCHLLQGGDGQTDKARYAPPEEAPDCLTCNDHGAVGNILNAEPCPDCTMKRVTGCSVSNGETQTAPVELPEPVAYRMHDPEEPDIGHWLHEGRGMACLVHEPLYTEQQVRELLDAQERKHFTHMMQVQTDCTDNKCKTCGGFHVTPKGADIGSIAELRTSCWRPLQESNLQPPA